MSSGARFKSKDFTFPFGVKLANALLSNYRNKKFDPDHLIHRARQKAGLEDFGSSFWMEPMRRAIADMNDHTAFHPLGAFIYEQRLIQNLVNRLWSQYWLKQDETIATPLGPSVMITGLQRSGTTFLQRLMGAMPEFRGVHSWEIVNPVPTSKRKHYNGKALAWMGLKALNYINPEFRSIHAINYNSLDEEVVLMEHSFMSSVIEAALSVPNYSLWLEQQDQKLAYSDLKMWLQFLVWRRKPESYLLLKSPHHMEYLDDFMHVFPGTKIIYMHRHPKETMGSYCSMMHFAKKMFQSSSNPHEIGRHWLRKNKRLVSHAQSYKCQHPEQFIDISYKTFIKDPIMTLKDIYLDLGLCWTEAHTQRAEVYCAEHRKHKHGKHVYSLTDYGLTESIVKEHFSAYLEEEGALL